MTTSIDNETVIRVATVDYVSFVKLSYYSWIEIAKRFDQSKENYSFPENFFEDIRHRSLLTWFEVSTVLFFAVFWSYLRIYLTKSIFLPIAVTLGASQQNHTKLSESSWKFLFYSFSWSLSVYILLISGRYQYFWDPLSVWDGWYQGMPVPLDIQFIYLLQCSFYIHSIYGTIFLDTHQKDFMVMLCHHFLSITLIGFSFAFRCHAVGILVLLLHDINDVIMEFAKINFYLKLRNGKYQTIHDTCASVGFIVFLISWFAFRLYWFPLKVIYATMYGSVNGALDIGPRDIPFFYFFNIMLWILLAMNCFWFSLALNLSVKIVLGYTKKVSDPREIEDTENGAHSKKFE